MRKIHLHSVMKVKKITPWSGTKTYSDAMEIIRKGYYEPLEKMKKAVLNIGRKEDQIAGQN